MLSHLQSEYRDEISYIKTVGRHFVLISQQRFRIFQAEYYIDTYFIRKCQQRQFLLPLNSSVRATLIRKYSERNTSAIDTWRHVKTASVPLSGHVRSVAPRPEFIVNVVYHQSFITLCAPSSDDFIAALCADKPSHNREFRFNCRENCTSR